MVKRNALRSGNMKIEDEQLKHDGTADNVIFAMSDEAQEEWDNFKKTLRKKYTYAREKIRDDDPNVYRKWGYRISLEELKEIFMYEFTPVEADGFKRTMNIVDTEKEILFEATETRNNERPFHFFCGVYSKKDSAYIVDEQNKYMEDRIDKLAYERGSWKVFNLLTCRWGEY